jgi:hypothetical protein
MQDEPTEQFVLVLANPFDEARAGQRLAHFVGSEAILGEAKVEQGGDGDVCGAELFLLLGEIGAADEANGNFVAEGGEDLEDFRCD